jgi:hypothetical protein
MYDIQHDVLTYGDTTELMIIDISITILTILLW